MIHNANIIIKLKLITKFSRLFLSKSESTDIISSKFTFGERLGLGTNIGVMNLEAYIRHFSNGTLTDKNSGQSFVGLSTEFKF